MKISHDQGYLLLAFGAKKYLDMAYVCALSIRHYDRERPIQLVTDVDVGALDYGHRVFDLISTIDVPRAACGPMLKLEAYRYSAFAETLFIDTDCFVLKSRIRRIWEDLSEDYEFGIPGEVKKSGTWYDMPIAEMCRAAEIVSLVQINSGAFFFKRGQVAESVFAEAKQFHDTLGNVTGLLHYGTTPSDEPFLAMALGKIGIVPMPVIDEMGQALMLTTINGREFELDAFSGFPHFRKGKTLAYPTIVHFPGVAPREIYLSLAEKFTLRYSKNDWPNIKARLE